MNYEELVEAAAAVGEEAGERAEVIPGHRRPYTVRARQDPLQFSSEIEISVKIS